MQRARRLPRFPGLNSAALDCGIQRPSNPLGNGLLFGFGVRFYGSQLLASNTDAQHARFGMSLWQRGPSGLTLLLH